MSSAPPRVGFLQSGFTLIELMVTTAIVGILASVAIPAYSRFVMKARWADNLSIVSEINKRAMVCQMSTGGSCSGHTGQLLPRDIDYDSWPQGRYMTNVNVAFSPNGNGFHVYFDATPEVGGYHYSLGFSVVADSGSLIPTQSFQDNVPSGILAAMPVNPASSNYHY